LFRYHGVESLDILLSEVKVMLRFVELLLQLERLEISLQVTFRSTQGLSQFFGLLLELLVSENEFLVLLLERGHKFSLIADRFLALIELRTKDL
jgi:hypothetical protein